MIMKFLKTKQLHISLWEDQYKEISKLEKIDRLLNEDDDDISAYDIYDGDTLIGFAMLNKYEPNSYFLWNYAIDKNYQNHGLGTKALHELIEYLKKTDNLKIMTTTYIWGNEHAKHMYEKAGFIETDVVDEPGIHEVNMELVIRK